MRALRPWFAGTLLLIMLVLLAPTSSWSGCAAGVMTGGECTTRTITLVGTTVPASFHPGPWLLSGILAGAVAWILVTALMRQVEHLERTDDLA